MLDRRQMIIDAALGVLRDHGFVGFTQPRVAARAGLRQSHITYYYPTRLDLLAAVGRAAVERQLAAVDTLFAAPLAPAELAAAIAGLATRHDNTRVLLALAQAGDEEPRLRDHFRDLVEGIVGRVSAYFARLHGHPPDENLARLLHMLSVGVAVVDLATGGQVGKPRAAGALQAALRLITQGAGPAPQPSPEAPTARNEGEKP